MLKILSIIFFAVIGGCQEKVQDDYIRIDHIGINSGDNTQIVDLIISVNQKKVYLEYSNANLLNFGNTFENWITNHLVQ